MTSIQEYENMFFLSTPPYNNYLCTYNLYGAVCSGFDAGKCLYAGKWEGVGPWNREFLGPQMASRMCLIFHVILSWAKDQVRHLDIYVSHLSQVNKVRHFHWKKRTSLLSISFWSKDFVPIPELHRGEERLANNLDMVDHQQVLKRLVRLAVQVGLQTGNKNSEIWCRLEDAKTQPTGFPDSERLVWPVGTV